MPTAQPMKQQHAALFSWEAVVEVLLDAEPSFGGLYSKSLLMQQLPLKQSI